MKLLTKETKRGLIPGLIFFFVFLFLYLPIDFINKPNLIGFIDETWLNFLIGAYSETKQKDDKIAIMFIDKSTKDSLNIKGPFLPSFYLNLIKKIKENGVKLIVFDISISDFGDNPFQKKLLKESIESNVIYPVYPEADAITNNLVFPMNDSSYPFLAYIGLPREKGQNKVYAYYDVPGKRYFSLPLTAASFYENAAVELIGNSIKIKDVFIPLISENLFFVNYYKNKPQELFHEIKIEDFLNNTAKYKLLEDKIVIIGASGNIAHDKHHTPLGIQYGSEIFATVLKNILDNDFLFPVKTHYFVFYTLFLVLLQGIITSKKKPMEGLLITATLSSLVLLLSFFLFKTAYVLHVSFPLLAVIFNYLFIHFFRSKEVERLLNLHSNFIDEIDKTKILRKDSVKEWLEYTLELVCKSIKAHTGAIFLFNKGEVDFYCGVNAKKTDSKGPVNVFIKEKISSIKEAQYILINTGETTLPEELQKNNIALVVLAGKEREVGVLMITKKKPYSFTEEELKEVLMTAIFSGMFLENSFLVEMKKKSYIETIFALANALEARDLYTSGHSQRVSDLSVEIAKKMGWGNENVAKIRNAGLLHDIGKIGIPEYVLGKTGSLTQEEFTLMKQHPAIGAKILKPIEEMKEIVPIILHHHEKFGGGGYPDGLKGEEIPLGARIIAVADTYDAITSDRPYRKGKSREEAIEEITKYANIQFDPKIVEKFLNL